MPASETPSQFRSPVTPAVLVGLVVGLFGIPLLGQLDVAAWLDATTAVAMLLTTLEKWLLVGVLLTLVVYWERRSVESVGLQFPGAREALAALGIGLGAVVLGLLATGVAVVTLRLDQPETLSTVSRLSLPVKVLLVLTAAVTEELLWRSYPIERLTELTGRLWIGAGVSAVVFLAVHFPDWGVAGAVPQAVFTLVLVGVYVWRRNVVTCMVTHAVINVVMILLLPAFL